MEPNCPSPAMRGFLLFVFNPLMFTPKPHRGGLGRLESPDSALEPPCAEPGPATTRSGPHWPSPGICLGKGQRSRRFSKTRPRAMVRLGHLYDNRGRQPSARSGIPRLPAGRPGAARTSAPPAGAAHSPGSAGARLPVRPSRRPGSRGAPRPSPSAAAPPPGREVAGCGRAPDAGPSAPTRGALEGREPSPAMQLEPRHRRRCRGTCERAPPRPEPSSRPRRSHNLPLPPPPLLLGARNPAPPRPAA